VANSLRSHEELSGDREEEIRKLEAREKKTENKGKMERNQTFDVE
jgi:hypothetical protein